MNLIGVWQSTDQRDNRYIYVSRVDNLYAYGRPCSPKGVFIPGAMPVRVKLSVATGQPSRYRRPTAQGSPS